MAHIVLHSLCGSRSWCMHKVSTQCTVCPLHHRRCNCWCWRPTPPRHLAHFADRQCDTEVPSQCTATLLHCRIPLCEVSKQRCECGHGERLVLRELYCLPARHLCSSPCVCIQGCSLEDGLQPWAVVHKTVDWADKHAEAAPGGVRQRWQGRGVAETPVSSHLLGARFRTGGAGRRALQLQGY